MLQTNLFQKLSAPFGQFSQILLMRLYAAAASFALTMLLGRLLGPDGFGAYVFALGLVSIAVLFTTFGFQHLAVRTLPQMLVRKAQDEASGFILGTFLAVSVLSVTVCALAIWNVPLLAQDTVVQGTVAAAAGLLLVRSLNLMRTGVLQGLGRPIAGHLPDRLIEPSVLLIAVLVWVYVTSDISPRTAMFLTAGASLLSLLIGLHSLRRAIRSIWHPPDFSKARDWVIEAGKSSVLFGAATLLGATDVIMLGYLSTPEETGLYGVAARFFLLVSLPFHAAGVRISQQAAKLHAENDLAGLETLSRGLANRMLLATLALAIPSTVAALYIEVIFGAGFSAAATPLLILVWLRVVISAAGVPGPILANTRHVGTTAMTVVAATALNIVLNGMLAPRFGANGAAAATVVSLALMTVGHSVMLRRRLGIYSFVTR
ncbi:oligosaccharide flippase family protein [Cognatishimia maritima]|uniref:Membrane protein involved in the export of O-antigen and teichoic acid n=1 Tax=Cognatishimia maritima TaxID=870908 RepID=A0A1M5WDG3_9RHOB|nr:oligosaccharide flippase family protein [Cognatishimia maritima]SHH85510.1 Membrane protein involved in the export of O-antigen and teichoic acid [Cognatishimia maritima]